MTLSAIGWPVLDRFDLFGDFAISPHGIGIALGYLFGAWILTHEGPKRGVSVDHINTMVFWSLIGTIIGARLFYVIGHYSEFDSVGDMLALWRGGLTIMGGMAGAVLINIPLFRRFGYSFFQVMDGAVIGLSFGISFGRIGDLIIGDHLGKPTSWLLAWQYQGGEPAGFGCVADVCRTTLEGGQVLEISRAGATLTSATGEVLGAGVGVHQTAMYDMFFATGLFLVLYGLSRRPRRLGVLTLTFGAWYGTARVIEDFLRVDKRIFGLTGSQWTGLTVAIVCLAILLTWAVQSGSSVRREDDDAVHEEPAEADAEA
ncbi:MAG TPA: prolipoprotein diacylglyceryl transferase family protein [Actinomycetota bacterium]|nr:prolipoprotein diacylglyceryl transferase family protein [Actinomycetota bacterium]